MPRRDFVLYCHIQKSGLDSLRKMKGLAPYLQSHHGLLVLFLDDGLKDLLRMIHPIKRDLRRNQAIRAKQCLKQEFRDISTDLREAERKGLDLEQSLAGPDRIVRVITPLDLVDIFGEMSTVEDLKKYLTGTDGEIRYDSPKFVEAIVRLRMVGSRVPVFRLDQDVLICDPIRFKELQLAIECLKSAVKDHHDTTQVLATILSASYVTPAPSDSDAMTWHRGYATRILPALRVPLEKNAKRYNKTGAGTPPNWETELRNHFDLALTQRFFRDLWRWGAPDTAVISGALLYMNDSVVLNVPPFSNFSQPVMWIDDHLRYVLHREMGDFCRQTQLHLTYSKTKLHVQYSDEPVVKNRPAEPFAVYTVTGYLPTLLWGSFVDSWLCINPYLKLRDDKVKRHFPSQFSIYNKDRRNGCPGELARAVHEARAGCLPDEGLLRDNLIKEANSRLATIRRIWRQLRRGKVVSFASAWVDGTLPHTLRAAMREKGFPVKLPAKVEDFDGALRSGFQKLLYDTCHYVKWVYEWPRIVSVIRSVPPGEFRSDLDWK